MPSKRSADSQRSNNQHTIGKVGAPKWCIILLAWGMASFLISTQLWSYCSWSFTKVQMNYNFFHSTEDFFPTRVAFRLPPVFKKGFLTPLFLNYVINTNAENLNGRGNWKFKKEFVGGLLIFKVHSVSRY